MNKMQRSTTIGASRVAILAVSLGAVPLASCSKDVVKPLPAPMVRTAPVERLQSARELRMSGTIEAERSTALSFAVPGTVEQVLVDVGQSVRRGQVVARLTPTSFEHALGIAVAQADRAQDVVQRLQPMHMRKTVPDVKWVEAQTALAAANHAVEIARKSLNDAALRAPEDGVVARRNIEPGATVAPGIPAFQLVQTRIVRAVAPVPENEVAKIRKGQSAHVSVGALEREFTGTIYEVGVLADPLTRTYPVKITIANAEGVLKVGMVVDAFVPLSGEGPALGVPREAVRIDERGDACVFVVGPDQKVHQRHVKVIGFAAERTALMDGVTEGEQVVVSGTPMLGDGMTVRLADADNGGAR